jgi:DNA (cytosine-5)-methyltransferase 1
MANRISVIDLFAGPGGLGEGFSSVTGANGRKKFKIALSVEKEASAHSTLLLRAFYRQFRPKDVPSAYYDFLRGKLGKSPEDALYKIPAFKVQVAAARKEARCLTLGEHNSIINREMEQALSNNGECILIGGPPSFTCDYGWLVATDGTRACMSCLLVSTSLRARARLNIKARRSARTLCMLVGQLFA